jgi:hypothetical protein
MTARERLAIEALLQEPFDPDADFVPWFRVIGVRLPDVDPLRAAAEAREDFASLHRPSDALALNADVCVLTQTVYTEADPEGRTTVVRLGSFGRKRR